MARIKISTWNIKWMEKLFEKKTAAYSSDDKTDQTLQRIANLIIDLDADIIGIQEGPRLKAQMKLFVSDYLGNDYKVFTAPCLSPNSGRFQQINHFLVRKGLDDLEIKQFGPSHKIFDYLSRDVAFYRWSDVSSETSKKISRLPVVLSLAPKSSPNETIELMTFHTKSKFVFGFNKRTWIEREKPENKKLIVDALQARQRLSGELNAIRRYLSHAVLSQRTNGCILMGDLNDGPSRDVFEKKFLITNIVDELRGGFHREEAVMHHALSREWIDEDYAKAYTAKFKDPTQNDKIVKVLLDHILMSTNIKYGDSAIKLVKNSGKIEHEVFEANTDGKARHLVPSDHRPVSAKLTY